MVETDELIKRAREYARLAEKATPGPYGFARGDRISGFLPHIVCLDADGDASGEFIARVGSKKWPVDPADQIYDNAHLLAAAPDMAELLAEMANALEKCLGNDDRT